MQSEKIMKTETIKIALFDTGNGCRHVGTSIMEGYGGWSRLSHWHDVEFQMLDKEEVIAKKVESIEKEIQKIKDEAMEEVSKLQQKKAELLALSHEK